MATITRGAAWRALKAHAKAQSSTTLKELFASDPARAEQFSAEAAGIDLDYSKQRVNAETLRLLLELAAACRLPDWIDKMFSGKPVNHTESRPALHVALRAQGKIKVGGKDVMPAVRGVLERMYRFAEDVRTGARASVSGQRIRDVVNIGIGGSDLGPRMVCDALRPYANGPRVHYIANVDGQPLAALMQRLQAPTTLFVVTSKTFTTQETLANARAAREWLARSCGEAAVSSHFAAVSTNLAETGRFGIADDNVFEFWDWVGGRYSLWSAVGLSIVLAIGEEHFRALLAGARDMDEHFRSAPLERNLPVLMGLVGVWNRNFLGATSQVIAPYVQRLEKFVAWLQQLEMESNGKGVDRRGKPLRHASTPVLWGDVGTNAQHAFFQMLHQGTDVHPVDFIAAVTAEHPLSAQHRMLLANCLAQSAALMLGKPAAKVREELGARGLAGAALEAAIPHRVFTGNRPSSTLLIERLDPYHLGSLLALYEHRTFVQSVLWNVNAFDQWGVELGKQLAGEVLAGFDYDHGVEHLDGSTARLLQRIKRRL
jgi:glucose-6-phosphate isomerase